MKGESDLEKAYTYKGNDFVKIVEPTYEDTEGRNLRDIFC